jgi:hypothetical protein
LVRRPAGADRDLPLGTGATQAPEVDARPHERGGEPRPLETTGPTFNELLEHLDDLAALAHAEGYVFLGDHFTMARENAVALRDILDRRLVRS